MIWQKWAFVWLVGGLVGIYMWHGWYLEFRGPSVGMQDKTDALSRLCALRLIHCFGVSQCWMYRIGWIFIQVYIQMQIVCSSSALLWGFSVFKCSGMDGNSFDLNTESDCVLSLWTALGFGSVCMDVNALLWDVSVLTWLWTGGVDVISNMYRSALLQWLIILCTNIVQIWKYSH